MLAGAVGECLAAAGREGAVLPSLRRGADDRRVMLGTLAELHVRGRPVRWEGVAGTGGHVRLPPYPWRRERHWMEAAEPREPEAGAATGHPLLGRRLRGPRPAWECALDDPRLAYLRDHVVEGVTTFPAAAYVEVFLAAARGLAPERAPALEDVALLGMLGTPDPGDWLVQCVLDPEAPRLELHAARRGAERSWALHATARPAAARADAARAEDIAAVRARCPLELPAATLRRRAEAVHGLRYGPAFSGLVALWCGDGEALGRIEAPPSLGPARDHLVHPALLDAAFQAIVGVVGGAGDADPPTGGVVPVSVGRVNMLAPPGAAFWAHVAVARAGATEWTADVALLADDGASALVCEDLRLRALGGARRRAADAWVYAEESRKPAGGPPPRAAGGLHARRAGRRGAGRPGAGHRRSARRRLLRRGRAGPQPAGRALRAGRRRVGGGAPAVAPRHARLLERLAVAASLEGAGGDPAPLLAQLRGTIRTTPRSLSSCATAASTCRAR